MSSVYVMEHPLVISKISMLRDKNVGCKEFREIAAEIATFICYEATKDIPVTEVLVETPLEEAKCNMVDRKFAVIPILRAGIGMTNGILNLIPNAKIGHVGIYRDPDSLKPVEYYWKLPIDAEKMDALVIDPMLATGGTAVAAVDFLKRQGIKNIKFLCIIAAPEGVEFLQKHHDDVDIYVGAIDRELDNKGYIRPGLGDAGDRLFGTK